MATVVMFWDQLDPSSGDDIAGIEVYNAELIAIPDKACRFRLGLPGQPWHEAWYFAKKGTLGEPFSSHGITYSSAFTGVPSPDAIEARGPVHACFDPGSSGVYVFVTPLGQFGISGDAPDLAGAGSFVADFSTEQDIAWLDHEGTVIKVPGLPKPTKIPEKFFKTPPEVKGCFVDIDGKQHCPKEPAAAGPQGGTIGSFVSGPSAPQPSPLMGSDGGFIPHVSSIAPPAGAAAAASDSDKIELPCPAELVLTATFHKDPTFDPATVEYRFRFAHGPISTVFTKLVGNSGSNSVHHSVPVPLPPPLGQKTSGGGATVHDGGLTTPQKPDETINPPGGVPTLPGGPTLTTPAPPSNEHRSSVRVEVLNAEGGVIASPWARYHLVCAEQQSLRRGSRGTAVRELQIRLNGWRQARQEPLLAVDGIFGPLTLAAVEEFQHAHGLAVDGVVGARTWRRLRSLAAASS